MEGPNGANTREAMDVEKSEGRRSSLTNPNPQTTNPQPDNYQRRNSSSKLDDEHTVHDGSTSSSSPKDAANGSYMPSGLSKEEAPPIDEQIATVWSLNAAAPKEGQVGYVVACSWLARVLSRESIADKNQFPKDALEGDIGPVDNLHLLEEGQDDSLEDERGEVYQSLRRDIRIGDDFEILTEEAWQLILRWYDVVTGSEIRRYAHKTNEDDSISDNVQYELHPPMFTVRKLRNDAGGLTPDALKESKIRAPKVLASRHTNSQTFLKAAKEAAGIDVTTKVQLWRVVETIEARSRDDKESGPSGMLTPATSRSVSPSPVIVPNLVIDAKTFFEMTEGTHRELVDLKDLTNSDKYNGHLQIGTLGLATDSVLILDEKVSSGDFASGTASKAAEANGIFLASKSKAPKLQGQAGTATGRNSPVPGPMTRGRTRKDGRTRGTVGLTNLGNTCYMNSALQCIRSCEELTLYFLQGKYKQELNPSNPLAHNGDIAKSYAGLLASIYDEGGLNSFMPKAFKSTLGRYQPLFSGYGQQDSQEFLSFLVDGLHEDLNRILKKPYVENPESDDNTVGDPEAIRVLGDKFREIHRARNDSVAMDLFNGFYKNTMVCPECNKVSITFDPFSLLTLQLPIEQTWQHVVFFVPAHGSPIMIELDVDKNGTIRSIKDFIVKKIPGLASNRLVVTEVYNHKFYKTFEDSQIIAEANIQARDDIVIYEVEDVPTNFPGPKRKRNKVRSMVTFANVSSEDDIPESDSPLADRMLVPIFHRTISMNYGTHKTLNLRPCFIIVTRDEARDYDTILRKVLGAVDGLTTRDILAEDSPQLPPVEAQEPSDTVITTEEDASSNADTRVQAHSIEGEESIVDVSMSDEPETSADQPMDTDPSPQRAQASVLQAGSFIPLSLRGLFQMKFTTERKEMVPTGWSAVDQNRDYPTIESRIPQHSSRRSSIQSQSSGGNSTSTMSEESEDTPPLFVPNSSDLFPGDAESEEDHPPVADLRRQHLSKKASRKQARGKRKIVTYSRKGKRVDRSFTRPGAESPPSEPDDDPALIRLGEAIVLDWNSESYEALFDGDVGDDYRGTQTWNNMETMPDPELEAKRVKRAARRRSGVTLEECFAETAKGEILSEENAWYCNRCKELRRASKTLEIWTVPDILVIHLKRFSANRGFRDKVDVLVDFPIEGLDLGERVGLDEGKGVVYDLFAVDNHYGGLGGGHYTAFAQNFYDKRWYEYNDSVVSPRGEKSLVSTAAYLLFYRRRADHPLGPPSLQNIVHEAYEPAPDPPNSESAPSSRPPSQSPSGKGSRLDGSSPDGSSSASAAAGAAAAAARQLRGGAGSGGGTRARSASRTREESVGRQQHHVSPAGAQPPVYEPGFGDGLLDDEDDTTGGPAAGPAPWTITSWAFPSLDKAASGEDDEAADDADAASDTAARGSQLDEDLRDRLMEDFGDEPDDFSHHTGLAPGQVSPDLMGLSGTRGLTDNDEILPELVDAGDVAIGMERGDDDDDAPVAEVRVDDKDDIKLD